MAIRTPARGATEAVAGASARGDVEVVYEKIRSAFWLGSGLHSKVEQVGCEDCASRSMLWKWMGGLKTRLAMGYCKILFFQHAFFSQT